MLPRVTELEFDTEEVTETPPVIQNSFLYDFEKGQFVLRDGKLVELEGIEALKMWIIKVMKTERDRFKIYENEEYGTTIEDLIGTNYPRQFVEAEIKREVTSSLLNHPYIIGVQNWEFIHDGKWMRVRFKVVTPDNTFEQEVMI